MRRTRLLLLAACFLLPQTARAVDNVGHIEDEQTCRAAGAGVSGPELLDFLRQRTPAAAERRRIAQLVDDLDGATFATRQAAGRKLIEAGPAALPFLRAAMRGNSLEMTRRTERCIEEIEQKHSANVPAAAARLLRARQPDGACDVLLAYLPYAQDSLAEEEALAALASLGGRTGKPDPLLIAALKDPAPARRGAAALVVGRLGTAEQQKEVARLLADTDPKVCLRAAQGLIAARDKRAVAALFALVSGAPLDLAVQAEDLLARVAGDQAPGVNLTDATNAVRRQCRDAWEAWWKKNEDKVDLARADVEIFSESTAYRARSITTRFKNALVNGDVAALKQTTDAPFYWFAINDQRTRRDLDDFWEKNPTGGLEKLADLRIAIKGVFTVDEFAKVGTKEAQAFLAAQRKETIRVVYVDVVEGAKFVGAKENAETVRVGVLVRVSGQPRVLGVTLIAPANP